MSDDWFYRCSSPNTLPCFLLFIGLFLVPLSGLLILVFPTLFLLYLLSTYAFFALTPVILSCCSNVASNVLSSFGFPLKFTAPTMTLLFCVVVNDTLPPNSYFLLSFSFGDTGYFQNVQGIYLILISSLLCQYSFVNFNFINSFKPRKNICFCS